MLDNVLTARTILRSLTVVVRPYVPFDEPEAASLKWTHDIATVLPQLSKQGILHVEVR